MTGAFSKKLVWGGALCLAAAAHAGTFWALEFGSKNEPDPTPVEYEIILPPLGNLDASMREEELNSQIKSETKPEPKSQSEPTPKQKVNPKPIPKPDPKPKPKPIIPNPEPIAMSDPVAPSIPIETLSNVETVQTVEAEPQLSHEDTVSFSDQGAPPRNDLSTSDAPPSSKANFGVSSGVAKGRENFAGTLQAWLLKHKRYPHRARARNLQGVVHIWFRLDENGGLLDVRIAESSGHKVLDQATLDLMKRVSPFPAPPLELRGTDLIFIVPVAYRLN